jgi:SnoaL-like domain
MTTGRLGSWEPATLEERVDRLDSLAQIRQLAMRYGQAIDARDLDKLVDLFAPDVRVGRQGEGGRAVLRAWYDDALRQPRTSIHFMINHIVDFDDADHAHGVVYCRDELERPESGHWEVGTIQYWDRYARYDGAWCFVERKFHRWYIVDALERPAHGAGLNEGEVLFSRQLPEAYPTWAAFWAATPAVGEG